jgi:ferredoxin
MAKFKVELVRKECTACESCVESCPDYFEMADDALVNLKGSTKAGDNEELEVDTLGCIKDAADACPVNIIHIYEGANKII